MAIWTFGPLLRPGEIPGKPVFLFGMVLIAGIFAMEMRFGYVIRLPVLYIFPLAAIALHVPQTRRLVGILAFTISLQGLTLYSYRMGWASTIVSFFSATASTILVVMLARAARNNYLKAMDLATFDALTGAHNNRSFQLITELEIKRQKRYGGTFSLIVLDLDHFKELNDSQGHEAGNQALKLLGDTLRENTRGTDVIGRIGGDEFGILMPNTIRNECAAIAKHLVLAIADRMSEHGFPITASIGSKTFQSAPDSYSTAATLADEAMYLAKEKRNLSVSA